VHKICVGLAAALLLAASVSAPGEPSLIGYTGLLPAPTADTLGDPQYNIAIASTEAQNWEDRAYLANFGLQPGLEAGVQWWHPENGGAETLLNLKYRFQPPSPGRASLAVGVSDQQVIHYRQQAGDGDRQQRKPEPLCHLPQEL